ncbi:DUF4253 domain-containing protein [Streptomyces sp. NPDC059002]|uniref:DUF4253 domain-containing protein n=1 Tax=Streptomyces sp. NPDC059002 TaxID=3346690 RepID=UPI003689C3EC
MTFTMQQLPGGLPPGRLIVPDPQYSWPGTALPTDPVLWISDEPSPPAEAGRWWGELLRRHRETGLWPLLLGTLPASGDAVLRPWHNGELKPTSSAAVDEVDLAAICADGWEELWEGGQPPYPAWPGMAPGASPTGDPDDQALALTGSSEGVTAVCAGSGDGPYLGLTAATDSAAAIMACGWQPEIGSDAVAAMVRTWDRRFGVRLCSLGFQAIGLSVGRPPRTPGHARQVAAEHVAFCPEIMEFGDFDAYAAALVDAPVWTFQWY